MSSRAGVVRSESGRTSGAAVRRWAWLLVLLAIGFLPAAGARADDSFLARGGAFIPRDEDPRAIALGGATIATPEGAAATFVNPASLSLLPERRLEAGYGRPLGLSVLREGYLAFAAPFTDTRWETKDGEVFRIRKPSRSGLGAALQVLSVDLDPESYTESALALAYGAHFWSGFAWGLTGRYLRAGSDLADLGGTGYGLDAALLWSWRDRLRVGARVENLVGRLSWDFGTDESLPTRVELGAAGTVYGRFLLVAQLTSREESSKVDVLGAGIECTVVDALRLRAGYRRIDQGPYWESTLRGGLGIRYGRLSLDYSFSEDVSFLDETHRIALGFTL